MFKHIVIAGIAAMACGMGIQARGYAWLPANYGTRF